MKIDTIDISDHTLSALRVTERWMPWDLNGKPSGIDSKSDCASVFGTMYGGHTMEPGDAGISMELGYSLQDIPHQAVRAEIDLVILDSWGASGSGMSADDSVTFFLLGGYLEDGIASQDYLSEGVVLGSEYPTFVFQKDKSHAHVCGHSQYRDIGEITISARAARTKTAVVTEELSVNFQSELDECAANESVGVLAVRLMVR